jgi:hypothetical protein
VLKATVKGPGATPSTRLINGLRRPRTSGVSEQPPRFSPRNGRRRTAAPRLISKMPVTAVRKAVSAPMGSGLVKGRAGSALGRAEWIAGLWWWRDRRSEKARTGFRSWLACTHSGPEGGVRMTVSPDPGCSVRSTAVLQAHAETRARPVPAFSDVASSWDRMGKERASSRRAIAVVAMFLPRRWASSP